MMKSKLLEKGQRFNYLTVLKLDHIEKQINPTDKGVRNIEYYLCQCDCGKLKVVEKKNLKRGKVKSCGCKTYNLKENIFVKKENCAELHITTKREEKPVIVLVDKEDVERINIIKWNLKYDKTLDGYYVYGWQRNNYKNRKQYRLHRFITNCPDNMQVDHINRNTLDNRKCNLKVCTLQENLNNKGKYKNNTSGYKNVWWDKTQKKWICEIKRNNHIVFQFRNNDLNIVVNARNKFFKESGV